MYEYGCTVTRVVDGDTVDVILDLGFSILHKCRVRNTSTLTGSTGDIVTTLRPKH